MTVTGHFRQDDHLVTLTTLMGYFYSSYQFYVNLTPFCDWRRMMTDLSLRIGLTSLRALVTCANVFLESTVTLLCCNNALHFLPNSAHDVCYLVSLRQYPRGRESFDNSCGVVCACRQHCCITGGQQNSTVWPRLQTTRKHNHTI